MARAGGTSWFPSGIRQAYDGNEFTWSPTPASPSGRFVQQRSAVDQLELRDVSSITLHWDWSALSHSAAASVVARGTTLPTVVFEILSASSAYLCVTVCAKFRNCPRGNSLR